MNKTSSRAALACATLMTVGLGACSGGGEVAVVSEPAPTVPVAAPSTLVVRWSIDGVIDPNECIKSVSAEIEISVFDRFGGLVGVFRQACEAFSTSITLNPGDYTAEALLLDGAGQPRTTS